RRGHASTVDPETPWSLTDPAGHRRSWPQGVAAVDLRRERVGPSADTGRPVGRPPSAGRSGDALLPRAQPNSRSSSARFAPPWGGRTRRSVSGRSGFVTTGLAWVNASRLARPW